MEIFTQGTLIHKKIDSETSAYHSGRFMWFWGVVQWRSGGLQGEKIGTTDEFITAAAMIMVSIDFLQFQLMCYLGISQCTLMIQKVSQHHATSQGCHGCITLAIFLLVSQGGKFRIEIWVELCRVLFQSRSLLKMANWQWIYLCIK